MYMILFSFNVYGWNKCHINYKLIFNYKLQYSTIFEVILSHFLIDFLDFEHELIFCNDILNNAVMVLPNTRIKRYS